MRRFAAQDNRPTSFTLFLLSFYQIIFIRAIHLYLPFFMKQSEYGSCFNYICKGFGICLSDDAF